MKGKTFVAILAGLVVFNGFGRQASDFDDYEFCSLRLAIEYDLASKHGNAIYELEEDARFGVLQVNEDGTVVARTETKYALVVPRSNDLVDHQMVYGPRYYRYVGTGRFSFLETAKPFTVRKFKEVSERERDNIEEYKRQLALRIEQRKHELRRQAALDKALDGIRDLTDDEKTINFSYQKVGEKYDEAYKKTASETEAESVANEAAGLLLDILRKEIERKELAKKKEFEEWAKTHPVEYAEMLKAKEAERQRKAKLKLESELKENAVRMAQLKSAVESFRESNPHGSVPRNIDELKKFFLRRMLPKYDVWKEEFSFVSEKDSFSIVSHGPDRKKGSEDDIVIKIASLKGEETPLAKEIAESRKNVLSLKTKIDEYVSKTVPSICGYKFGARAYGKCGDFEELVPLDKPFRKCKEACLRYHGQGVPYLTSVVLIGRFQHEDDIASRVEGEKIRKMLERNFKIRFGVIKNLGSYFAASTSPEFKVEIRNDIVLNDGNDDVILTVSFEELELESMIDGLYREIGELEAKEKELKEERTSTTAENVPSDDDDEGLDVLSGSKTDAGGLSGADVDKDSTDNEKRREGESVRDFRARMESRWRNRQETVDRPVRRSGIIEAKREGKPISTTD